MTNDSRSSQTDRAAAVPYAAETDQRLNLVNLLTDSASPAASAQRANDGTVVRDEVSSLRQGITDRFGVQSREREGGNIEYYFRANGTEHSVAFTPATTDGVRQAHREIEDIVNAKVRHLESDFQVKFGKPGEEVTRKRLQDANCHYSEGEMVHATTPRLPALFAVEEALRRSQPGHLVGNGSEGIKIYFLDRQPLPPQTEGRPALGMYVQSDKDKQRALYITPEGAALPPTLADSAKPNDPHDPQSRNLLWCLIHELTHNSQTNMWGSPQRIPEDLAAKVGWSVASQFNNNNNTLYRYWMLNGASPDEHYIHAQTACGAPARWYRADKNGTRLGLNGNPVSPGEEGLPPISGNELRLRLAVKPATHYFTSPVEEFAESLAAFRYGANSRRELRQSSPTLYDATRQLDEQEILKMYGKGNDGRPRYVRLPDGTLAHRTPAAEREVEQFENSTNR